MNERQGDWRNTGTAPWIALALLLGLALLAGCRGYGEGSLRYPPDPALRGGPSGPLEVPPDAPTTLPDGAPAGIYFLHERDEGLDDCTFVGERMTGDGDAGGREAAQARSQAVLDLASHARWMGGNVVVLPYFQQDFRAGHLAGRVYRCGEAQRRTLYQRAAAAQQLTVVPP